jgi:opacity protein-like surface antigen
MTDPGQRSPPGSGRSEDSFKDQCKSFSGSTEGMMVKRLSLVLSAMILLQCQALAQYPGYRQNQKKWEFSFLAGFSSSGDQSSATPVTGTDTTRLVGLDFSSGYLVGLRITENLGERFGAELEYSLGNQPMAFVNLRPSLARLDLDHREHSIDYSVLLYALPTSSRLRPYAVAGLGACFYQIEGSSRDLALNQGLTLRNRWKLAGTWGGGLKYFVTDKWGVRFDVRDQITGVPDYGLPHASTLFQGVPGAAFKPNGVLQTWQFSAGFLVVWSGS